MASIVRFEDAGLRYGDKTVFQSLYVDIGRGEKVAVLGRSGLGKSSLLHVVLGFVRPTSGSVFFDGVRIDEATAWDTRRRTAFVDQDVSLGSGKVSAWLDFVAGLKVNAGLDFSEDRRRALFSRFDLDPGLADSDISQLSGGERQRLSIVTAILLNREVYLLDEATSALDKQLKAKVAGYFLDEPAWTVISVSHDAVWVDDPRVRVFDLEAGAWKQ